MSSSKTPRTWNEFFEEAEAEIAELTNARSEPELTPEQARLQARQEARDIANNIRLGNETGTPRTGDLAPILDDDATAKDIASRVRINGRTGGQPPQIKRAARFIDPLDR